MGGRLGSVKESSRDIEEVGTDGFETVALEFGVISGVVRLVGKQSGIGEEKFEG